jgi:hypothetical protein
MANNGHENRLRDGKPRMCLAGKPQEAQFSIFSKNKARREFNHGQFNICKFIDNGDVKYVIMVKWGSPIQIMTTNASSC